MRLFILVAVAFMLAAYGFFPGTAASQVALPDRESNKCIVIYMPHESTVEEARKSNLVGELYNVNFDEVTVATTERDLVAALTVCRDVVLAFQTRASDRFSNEFAVKELQPFLQFGGVVVMSASLDVPLDRWLGDGISAQRVGAIQARRHTAWIDGGDWLTVPHNLKHAVERGVTPLGGFSPQSEGWEVMAARLPADDDSENVPYMLRYTYGDGLFVLTSSGMGLGGGNTIFGHGNVGNTAKLIDNLLATVHQDTVKGDVTLHSSDGPLDVFLLIGQSNMAGRAAVESLDTGELHDAYLFNGTSWEPLQNPVNRHSTVIEGDAQSRLGPGYSFARKVTELTGKPIGIVSNARGATAISWWQKGYTGNNDYDLYEEAVARTRLALESNPGAKLVGIIWHQGEGDNSPGSAANYLSRLYKLVEDLRTDLKAPDATLIIGEVGTWSGRGQHVNPVIQKVAERIPNAHWVSSAGLVPLPLRDGSPNLADPHFNTLSQRILGQRFADKALREIYEITPGVVTLYTSNELYRGIEFSGYSASLPVGEYDAEVLEARGIILSNLGSFQVQSGYVLELHSREGSYTARNDHPLPPEMLLEEVVQSISVRPDTGH